MIQYLLKLKPNLKLDSANENQQQISTSTQSNSCNVCGELVNHDANYCSNCGNSLEQCAKIKMNKFHAATLFALKIFGYAILGIIRLFLSSQIISWSVILLFFVWYFYGN